LHLVLNAAYDTSILLAQVRAFSVLPIEDIVLAHLDEETRWGKIWNLALGSPYPIRFLSSGHNIPGDFSPATPDRILSRQFERN
jgi:flagellar biosynthesis GTPase FlhF